MQSVNRGVDDARSELGRTPAYPTLVVGPPGRNPNIESWRLILAFPSRSALYYLER